MKKLFAAALALAMLLSLAACTPSGNITEPGVQPEEKEFSLGTITNYTYVSDFIGISCNIDRDWRFYTDAEIRQLNNITEEMAGEEYKEAVKNADVIFDMFATSNDGLENLNVTLEKVNPHTLELIKIENNYIGVMPTLKSSFENMGCTDIKMELGKCTMYGKEFPCLNTSAKINGIEMYQTLISIKCNGYLASISITSFAENNISSILQFFYEAE